jgi:hypothetical protein
MQSHKKRSHAKVSTMRHSKHGNEGKDEHGALLLRGLGVTVPVPNSLPLLHLSRYWTYVVGNRLRFTAESRATSQRKAVEDFCQMGVLGQSLASLSDGSLIEVSMPFEHEAIGWECRTCPWESLLSLATKVLRKPYQHLTVVRHLRPRLKATPRPSPASLLVVVSASGKLREYFDFSREFQLIQNSFAARFRSDRLFRLNDPSLSDLKAWVAQRTPDIIHLAGIDAHQKATLLAEPDDPLRRDGFVLRDERGKLRRSTLRPWARSSPSGGTHHAWCRSTATIRGHV